ncbi:sugar porter family MFS transporter [Aliiglaciecola sp. LCG003]|uniref:sugar porter family MFS transporter n=1 Tax=Aliiglaciecola sp. LCG003 TaxID=3053655 RepID=UPI002572E14E|nr:sugar porter family MFS transporter [Aliiglaciecola sp. LCG003]WJG10132.1 sugar porter family MFS transporter [Aliiglaciecola sp. LCG003]
MQDTLATSQNEPSAYSNSIFYVCYVSLIVALGGLLMGFDASVISGVVGFIESEFNLTKLQLGWAVASLSLTATFAMLVSGPLSDKFGRKTVLKIAALLFLLSAVLSALAPSFTILVIARMLGGLGVGAALIIAPMYIAEIAPAKYRGRLVSLNQLNIVIGISVAFFTNYMILTLGESAQPWTQQLNLQHWNWRWMLGLEALPALLYFVALFWVPESPRWLVLKGKVAQAKQIMLKVSHEQQVDETIKQIVIASTSTDKQARLPIKELFKPAMRLVMIVGVSIAILQQITGINAVFFYAPMIFEQSGFGTDAAFMQAILVGLINIVFTVIAIALIDRIGRKVLLLAGVSGIVLSMFMLAYQFNLASYELTTQVLSSLPSQINADSIGPMIGVSYSNDLEFKHALVTSLGSQLAVNHESFFIASAIQLNQTAVLIGLLAFVACFAVSLGPVMWVLFSELFPNRIRALAISFVGLINSATSFTVQLVFPWELANLGATLTFALYGIFALVGLIIVLIYLPKTKGKTLEELEASLAK